MTEFIHVHTTTDSRDEAQKIAETVVSRRLAACCWISSPIVSIYWWKGKMEQSQEWVCSIKTRRELYDEIEKTIKEIHSYEEPAIIATPFVAGSENVTTIELNPGVQDIARCNPWSRELFANPNITQVIGDAYEVVPDIAAESFDRIMHAPLTLKLAGQLYSGAFYRELYRVLKRGGRLFHYIGDLNSKAGSGVTHGVMRRLQEAGFSRVVPRIEAYGVVVYK